MPRTISKSKRGSHMRVSLRILAVFDGIVGALMGFAISIVASILRVIGGAVGISTDQAHFFLAIALSLLAFVGALLAIGPGLAAAICLLIAAIGFFFVAGPWAIVPALFLLPAAWLAYVGSRAPTPTPVAAPQPQPMMAQPQPTYTEAPRQPSIAESRTYAKEPAIPPPAQPAMSERESYSGSLAAERRAAEMPPMEEPSDKRAAEWPRIEEPTKAPAVESSAQSDVTEAGVQPATPALEEGPVASGTGEEPVEAKSQSLPPVQPEPQSRREAQRVKEPPPDTSLPGAPA